MSQSELDAAVAAATGEYVRTVRRHGFSLVRPRNLSDPDAEELTDPQTVDWDDVDYSRCLAA